MYVCCEIYTPSLGFTSVSWAAEKNGHRVIFVDVDDNLLFDGIAYENIDEITYSDFAVIKKELDKKRLKRIR